MQNKPNPNFQKLSLQKFQQISQTSNFFLYHKTLQLPSQKLSQLLQTLQKYCFLITNNNQSIFEIEQDFYDTQSNLYQLKQNLNRPNRLQIYKQTIFLEPTNQITLNINQIKHSKTKTLQLPSSQNLTELQINQILQQYQGNTPYLYYSHSLSFNQILLYQPHEKTIIKLQTNLHKTTKSEEINLFPNQIQIQQYSTTRHTNLTRIIKKLSSDQTEIKQINKVVV